MAETATLRDKMDRKEKKRRLLKLLNAHPEIKTDDSAFKQALDAVVLGDQELVSVVTGGGGCGKTTLAALLALVYGDRCLCMAYTGIAAWNLEQSIEDLAPHPWDGSLPAVGTIHSTLRLSPAKCWNPGDEKLVQKVAFRFRDFDVALVDEVSMVNPFLMDIVLRAFLQENQWRMAHHRLSVRLVFVGDPMQLPPVVTGGVDGSDRHFVDNEEIYSEKSRMFFHSHYYRKALHCSAPSPTRRLLVERPLQAVYRQSDTAFRAMLNAIREGVPLGVEGLAALNSRVCPDKASQTAFEKARLDAGDRLMVLAGTNREVEALNKEYENGFEAAGAFRCEHHAAWSVLPRALQLSEGDPMNIVNAEAGIREREAVARRKALTAMRLPAQPEGRRWNNKTAHIPKIIKLYEGAVVMCLKNAVDGVYKNGTMARIVGFDYEGLPMCRRLGGAGDIFTVRREEFKSYRSTTRADDEVDEVFKQIGCRLARASTFHKSQGLTLDSALILNRPGTMSPNVLYLALSRVRTLDGVALACPLSQTDLDTNRYMPSAAFLKRAGASPRDAVAMRLSDAVDYVLSDPPEWRP